MTQTIGLLAATLVLATGCLTEQRYMDPEGGGPWVIAMQPDTPPFFESDDGNVYIVEQRVPFEFRLPTAEEEAALGDVAGIDIPYATRPYVERDDIEVQVDWTLSNVSENRVTTSVVLNGFNEFHEYNPGVQVVDNEVIADFSGWERTIVLNPGERRTGTIREEEMDEVAVDLATVVNGVTNANQIVYFENQSANDRRSMMFIPDVVPALTGIRMGLRITTEGEPVPVVLEFTVRIRDNRQILVQGNDEVWPLPAPTLFGPADIAPPAMTP
ncbi:MAG: hypothetical protein KC619_11590 [Myxococcales bacterium]|nr:hypothetical protein [Myxococcales bacterium]